MSGDWVSFDDLSTGTFHIGLWNLATGDVFAITSGTANQYLNAIDGDRVVYTDDRNGQLDVYLYTFSYTPPAAAELASLESTVASLPVRAGIRTSLGAKLADAQAALAAGDVATACGDLLAFEHEVRAQTGKAIAAADAASLVADAETIRAALGC